MLPAFARRCVATLLATVLAATALVTLTAGTAHADADAIYRMVNYERAKHGARALIRDARLDAVAQEWSRRMAGSNRLAHNPSLSSQVPSGWSRVGENVGYAGSDAGLHAAWMRSSGHRANILSSSYTSVGIGWVRGRDGRVWGTQVFASYRGFTPARVGINDLTGDVRTDLVARQHSTGMLYAYRGAGRGTLSTRVRLTGEPWRGLTAIFSVADATRDRSADLYSVDRSGRLWFHRGRANGTLDPRVRLGGTWGWVTAFADGDANRDGISDLYTRDSAGRMWYHRGLGNAGFAPRVDVGTGWNSFTVIVSPGDVTGDATADLYARDAAGRLWMYRGLGNGRLGARTLVGSGWHHLTAIAGPGDANGDAIGDLYGRDAAGTLWFYRGKGDGTFHARVRIGTGWNSMSAIN